MPPTDRSRPAVLPLGGGQVLLRGPAVIDVARLVSAGLLSARRNGLHPPARLKPLLQALEAEAAAAMSADGHPLSVQTGPSGHADMAQGPLSPQLVSTEMVDAEEAGQMLGLSARQVRRLTHQLEGRKVGRHWMFERAAVASVAAERSAA